MQGGTGQFTRFLAVGTLGFLADAGALYLLVTLGGDPYLMRLLSFGIAVSLTWWCNRNWTFQAEKQTERRREYMRYVAIQTVGICVSYAVYVAFLSLIGSSAFQAVLALATGSIVALGVNFIGAQKIVFRVMPV